ncbi:MAG: hypothetical protein NBV67_09100 [Tagaea sp.]|nr:hypothetical protein [Tagaea sp.]
MKPRRPTDARLRKLARKVVWWMAPDEALADPRRVIAQTLQWGDFDDMAVLRGHFGDRKIAEVLKSAPDGVLDRRSWSLWSLAFRIKAKPPGFREVV